MPSAAEDLQPAGRAPAQDVVPDAGELRLEPGGEGQRDRGQILDPLVAGVVRRSGDHRVHVAETEAQDVDVVDGVLDQAAAAGLGGVGPPL